MNEIESRGTGPRIPGANADGMLEESATVVALGPGIAWVETARRSACGACGSSGTCAGAVFGQLIKTGASRVAVTDTLGLRVGERVAIGIPDGLLVRASLTAYLLPLVALVAAAALAQAMGLPETAVAIAGIAGLAAGLWLTGRITGGPAARKRWAPVLLRRESVAIPVPFRGLAQ